MFICGLSVSWWLKMYYHMFHNIAMTFCKILPIILWWSILMMISSKMSWQCCGTYRVNPNVEHKVLIPISSSKVNNLYYALQSDWCQFNSFYWPAPKTHQHTGVKLGFACFNYTCKQVSAIETGQISTHRNEKNAWGNLNEIDTSFDLIEWYRCLMKSIQILIISSDVGAD